MNPYQRVQNALTMDPVDRVPVVPLLGAYGARLTRVALRTLFSSAEAYLAGQKALQAQFGFDLVLAPFDFSAFAEACGGEVAWHEAQVPNTSRPPFSRPAEALGHPLPDPRLTGRLPVFLETTRRLAELYRGRVPVVAAVPGPCIFPALLFGLDRWIEILLFNEEEARRLLTHTAPLFLAWSRALLEAGADYLVVQEGMAVSEVAPRSLFVTQFLPHLLDMFHELKAPVFLSGTGGSLNHNLDLLAGLPGLLAVCPGTRDDLARARELAGPQLPIVGNLDGHLLPGLTPDQVRQAGLDSLKRCAPAGPFLLGTAGADLPLATPPVNLRALKEAAERFEAEASYLNAADLVL
ncbi:uroporphyrinogen decarboxylase [Geomonas silvestris]|uniref:Uroporphyrinogen decarboxylase n=1 Tax=Geomonas silvestris TaxID=2740184 RepID=A0A6V8MEH6_9BACT|nr:uroporphyrinogen decarboxylase family protein [Geomonas silvestris]GFO58395.1 uroporphyrinogen decarboxylase [Geomonas silvestris]